MMKNYEIVLLELIVILFVLKFKKISHKKNFNIK